MAAALTVSTRKSDRIASFLGIERHVASTEDTLQKRRSETARKMIATTKLMTILFRSNTPLPAVTIESKSQTVVAPRPVAFASLPIRACCRLEDALFTNAQRK